MAVVVVDSTGPGSGDSVRIETATFSSSPEPADRPGDLADGGGIERSTESLVVVARVDDEAALGRGTGADMGADSMADEAGPGDAGPAGDDGSAGAGAADGAGSGTATAPGSGARSDTASRGVAGSAARGSGSGSGARSAGGSGTAPSSAPRSTAPSTTASAPATTAAPAPAGPTAAPPAPRANPGAEKFESIRNRDPLFTRHENKPASQISLDALTESAPKPDNGASPEGQFRMACNYSHFSYDDPIVFPGQPGKSHLHMFFGNTLTDAYSTTDSLVNSGGGSCNGFELNRSAYWTPAVLDGKGNTVVPDRIILYYKTKHPGQVQAMPQGLKMIAGNTPRPYSTPVPKAGWSCGPSGSSYNKSQTIPNNCGGDPVNAYIQFPFCWDGKNLDASDHMSHMTYVGDNESCPSSHPVRLPQISILLYFPAGNTSGWYVSSDRHGGASAAPGSTLHADWFGGWNDAAMDLWINGCMKRARNCSFGQTGTPRMFGRLNPQQEYKGNNSLPLPT